MAAAISAVLFALLLTGFSDGLKCRSGFESSLYGIPIQMWNESSPCSSGSQQSCFITNVTFNADAVGDLSLTFGSCVSDQYKSLLECGNLFGDGGIQPDILLAIVPALQSQLETAIVAFSQNAAQTVTTYLEDIGEGDSNVEIIASILTGAGVPFPPQLRPTLQKLDELLLTAILNQTAAEEAFYRFLDSFSGLNTTDPAASKLLYDFFATINITVPDQVRPVIDNLPRLIYLNFDGNETYEMINATIYQILGGVSNPNGNLIPQSLMDDLAALIPSEYNLHPLFGVLSELAIEIQNQNWDNLPNFSLELLKAYSEITPATEAISNATIGLLRGMNISLDTAYITYVRYQPGLFYLFFPGNRSLIDEIFLSTAGAIESSAQTGQLNLGGLLTMAMVPADFPGRHQISGVMEGVIERLIAGEYWVDAIGEAALESLKNVSVPTSESRQLSESIISFLQRMNVTLDAGFQEAITYFPGLFLAIFPEHAPVINMIYVNISQGLDDSDFDPFMSNMNSSASVESLKELIVVIQSFIPPELNTTFGLLDSIPELISQLSMNNTGYLDTWQVNLLMEYSVRTEATEALVNATFEMLARFQLYDILPEATKIVLRYQPGLFYGLVANGTMLDSVFYQMAAVIDTIGTENQFDTAGLLGLVNMTGFAGMDELLGVLGGFIEVASTGNTTDLAIYALEALKNASNLTAESMALSDAVTVYLATLNVTVAPELNDVIRYLVSLVYATIETYDPASVDMIFGNITMGLANATTAGPFDGLVNGLESLIEAGLLDPNLSILASHLPTLLEALLANDTSQVLSTIITISDMYNLPETAEATALTSALRNLTAQILGAVDPFLDLGLVYLPRIPLQLFPNYTSIINDIYNNITDGILNTNLSDPNQGQMMDVFESVDISMLPPELVLLLNYTQELVGALVRNDTESMRSIILESQSVFCMSTDITDDFATAIMDDLSRRGLVLQSEYRLVFECIPALTLAAFPNNTEMIAAIFQQMITAYQNQTVYIQALLAQYNVTLPDNVLHLLSRLSEIEGALTSGNFTVMLEIFQQYVDQTNRETELSRLIVAILHRYGLSLNQEQIAIVQQISDGFYNQGTAEYTGMLDALFVAMRNEIAAGKELGATIIAVLSQADIEIPPRAVPVITNIDSLIVAVNATMMGDGNALTLAYLTLLQDYNASFPSDQIQMQIRQTQLQILLQTAFADPSNINIPDEAFVYMEDIYRLTLKQANMTEEQLKALLIHMFPNMRDIIDLMFKFQPKEVFNLAEGFITWVLDEDRDAATLAGYINATLTSLLHRSNISLTTLLQALAEPKACKYATCSTDGCNVASVLPPDPTTTVTQTTTTTTAETTVTTTAAPTTTTTLAETTTSGTAGVYQWNIFSLLSFATIFWSFESLS